MEMKINFNKLFEIGDSNSSTPSTTSLEVSYQYEQPSVISTPINNVDLYYRFNDAIFFDSSLNHQLNSNLNILEDLSSIKKSFDNSFDKQTSMQPLQKKSQTNYQSQKINTVTFCGKQTIYLNQKNQKKPGERLYYLHKINQERKLKQMQRIKLQKQQQQKKQASFKPSINQNSKKILQLAESPMRKLANAKKISSTKDQQKKKNTQDLKQEQQMKKCTFHPILYKTPKNANYLSQQREAKNIFEELYNQHKIKQMKMKQAAQQEPKQQKKMNKKQLEKFFQRNEQYLQQKFNKEELMKTVSSQYDLTSGRKLFQPKINQSRETIFNALIKQMASIPSSKKLQVIKSKDFVVGQLSKSMQSQKSKSNHEKQKNKKKKNQSIKSIVIQSSNKQSKKKIISNNSIKRMPQKKVNKNNISFKPQPYQVSKLSQNNNDIQLFEEVQQNNLHQSNSSSIQLTYHKPNSNIFNKIKATESFFQQNYSNHEIQKDQQNYQDISIKQTHKKQVNDIENISLSIFDHEQPEKIFQSNDQASQDLEIIRQKTLFKFQNQNQKINSENQTIKEQQNFIQSHQTIIHQNVIATTDQIEINGRQIEQKPTLNELQQFNKITQSNENSHLNQENRIFSSQQNIQTINSNLLKTIEANPKITKTYPNLFDAEYLFDESNSTNAKKPDQDYQIYRIKPVIKDQTNEIKFNASSSSDEMQKLPLCFKFTQSIPVSPEPIGSLFQTHQKFFQIINQNQASDHHQKWQSKNFGQQLTFHNNQLIENSPIYLLKINQKQEGQNKQNWKDIFKASNLISDDHQPARRQKKETLKTESGNELEGISEDSPQKKPINIASLIKAKKKSALK